jgi:DNA polymerase-3 subunit beta
VKFQIDKGKVEIASSSPEFGEAKEVLMVDYAAAPVTICFNAQYVLDFLSVVETESISLDFKDEMSQAMLKPLGAGGYDYTYVIMPMRI